MQTFVPYSSIEKSVSCLDYRRLGKQRVEAMQIHNILTGRTTTRGWRNHPAVKMWEGYEDALAYYMNKCIDEWVRRGYNNTMLHREVPENFDLPRWFGDDQVHDSHKSNLLRKDPEYYGQYNWNVSDDLPYVWKVTGG
jgi:hypothetical protein